MYFFAVLTYPSGIPDTLQFNLTTMADQKFTKYIIVKEYGKNGTNPHLNIVYEIPDEDKHWSSNAHKFFRNAYATLSLPSNTRNLIKNKKCSSPANVVGGYLTKEDQYEIIQNKGFDVQTLQLEAKRNKTKQKITKLQAPDIIRQYINDNDITNLDDFSNFLIAIDWMTKDGYNVIPILKDIKCIWAVYQIKYLNHMQSGEETAKFIYENFFLQNSLKGS